MKSQEIIENFQLKKSVAFLMSKDAQRKLVQVQTAFRPNDKIGRGVIRHLIDEKPELLPDGAFLDTDKMSLMDTDDQLDYIANVSLNETANQLSQKADHFEPVMVSKEDLVHTLRKKVANQDFQNYLLNQDDVQEAMTVLPDSQIDFLAKTLHTEATVPAVSQKFTDMANRGQLNFKDLTAEPEFKKIVLYEAWEEPETADAVAKMEAAEAQAKDQSSGQARPESDPMDEIAKMMGDMPDELKQKMFEKMAEEPIEPEAITEIQERERTVIDHYISPIQLEDYAFRNMDRLDIDMLLKSPIYADALDNEAKFSQEREAIAKDLPNFINEQYQEHGIVHDTVIAEDRNIDLSNLEEKGLNQ